MYCKRCGSAASGGSCDVCGSTDLLQDSSSPVTPQPTANAAPPPADHGSAPVLGARRVVDTQAAGQGTQMRTRLIAGGLVASGVLLGGYWLTKGDAPEPSGDSSYAAALQTPATQEPVADASSTQAVPTSGTAPTGPPDDADACAGGSGDLRAAVGPETSCEFALNVLSAYTDNGGNGSTLQMQVHSPVTDLDYDMTCENAAPVVCTSTRRTLLRRRAMGRPALRRHSSRSRRPMQMARRGSRQMGSGSSSSPASGMASPTLMRPRQPVRTGSVSPTSSPSTRASRTRSGRTWSWCSRPTSASSSPTRRSRPTSPCG